ncbi:bifunctional nuclease family protein [Microbacterium hominis]|uniref:Bifunctional nuclease family protein n=1 Tax=Microbacterium hominis TaxID=162426 RepID=A0A7D4Q460_9MICO|nr:bifunctional nuclease family protein [Microbacterium hominis]QKJ20451.1 bifunctional nuclease family protein [Microbacterium hominis]
MIEVRVAGLAVDAAQQHVVLLKPVEGATGRVLPIWIGPQEATAILLAVEGRNPPRPLTADLLLSAVTALGAELDHVDVTRLVDGTYYAEVVLSRDSGPVVLDARPSDAIALAVRTGVALSVAEAVWVEGAIIDPTESDEEDAEPDPDESVSEFRRFLDGVDPEDFRG